MTTTVEEMEELIADVLLTVADVTIGDFSATVPVPKDEDSACGALCLGINEMIAALEKMRKKNETAQRELDERILTIERQTAAIRELSTPVLQIWEGIVILPLIGVVDTRRAQQVIEDLLTSIAETKSSVAIIDITGVPVIDTGVANHLLQTMAAANLLGASAILSGVSPTNAQTLVKLGIDLSAIKTTGSLKAALEKALDRVQ